MDNVKGAKLNGRLGLSLDSVRATAAVTTGAAVDFFVGRQAAELQCFAHVLLNGMLDFVQLFLRIQETTRHRVAQKGFTVLLKISDFLAAQGQRALLLLL